jgi:LCP family protein required for cell wall assembly
MFDYLDDPIPFAPDPVLRSSARARGTSLRRRHHLRLTIASTGVVAVLLVAGLGGFVRWKADQITRITMADIPQVDHGPVALPVAEAEPDGSFNALVVGVERGDGIRTGPGTRADTIMLVHVDRRAQRVQIVSIPRDLWVTPADGGPPDRLNAVIGGGGPAVLITTVNQTFGIPIHHYVQVDFAGFEDLVDAIGGLPIVFDVATLDSNTGLNLPAGCHVLNGESALALARSRHLQTKGPDGRWQEDPTARLARERREQIVVEAMVRRAGEHSLGIGGFAGLLDTATANLVLDDRLGRQDLLDLAALSQELQPGAVSSLTPPVTESVQDGKSVLLLAAGGAAQTRAFIDHATTSPDTGTGPSAAPDLIHLDTDHECGG